MSNEDIPPDDYAARKHAAGIVQRLATLQGVTIRESSHRAAVSLVADEVRSLLETIDEREQELIRAAVTPAIQLPGGPRMLTISVDIPECDAQLAIERSVDARLARLARASMGSAAVVMCLTEMETSLYATARELGSAQENARQLQESNEQLAAKCWRYEQRLHDNANQLQTLSLKVELKNNDADELRLRNKQLDTKIDDLLDELEKCQNELRNLRSGLDDTDVVEQAEPGNQSLVIEDGSPTWIELLQKEAESNG